MKEKLKHNQLSLISGIIAIVGLFAAIMLIVISMSFLAGILNFPYIEYIEYAFFILIVILIIRRWLSEYEYGATASTFTADVYVGSRSKRLLRIDVSDIKYIGTRLPSSFKGSKQRLTFKAKRTGVAYIVYNSGEKERCAYFSPSKRMLDFLEAAKENTEVKE